MNSFDVWNWVAGLPLRGKVLAFAVTVFVIELAFRRFAPRSAAYARWTATFQAVGKVWTAIILALIYGLSVGPIGLVMRALGKDPLDRTLAPEPSFWRAHEPSPEGPLVAVRRQF